MATLKDVAKKAGVAVSTASYALNNNKKISLPTRKKVLKAAKELNYKKNGPAADLKKRSSNIIALILSDLTGPYYSEIIKGVQDTALQYNYDLIVCSSNTGFSDGRESTGIKFLKEHRVDGAIVLSHAIKNEVLLETVQNGFPIVVVDRDLSSEHLTNISNDNYDGGFKATKYLIELGHEKIAIISGPTDTLVSNERFEGYKDALSAHDLTLQLKWIFNGEFTSQSGYQMTKILLSQNDLPTAVFYGNDEMAIGSIKAITEKGLSIPEDISIVGFDGIDLTELINPTLTTINQSKYEIGSLCARYLIHRLKGEEVPTNTNLKTELKIGGSTSSPKTLIK